MTFPRPRDYPLAWILGALVLLASVVAFIACGSESTADPVTTASPSATECSCGPANWITPVLNAGWTGDSVAYYRDPFGFVHFRGTIWSSGATPSPFSLPSGYRPDRNITLPMLSHEVMSTGETPASLAIWDGALLPGANIGAVVRLDGISFWAAP